MRAPERIQLSERQVRTIKWVGYPLFGIVVFFISLYASIPRDRLRDRLERELSQDPGPQAPLGTGMDVTISDLGLSLLPPGFSLREVTLKPRLAAPLSGDEGKKPQSYSIESLEARTSLFALLLGRRAGRVDLIAFGGELSVEGSLSTAEVSGELSARDIQLGKLPSMSQKMTLPLGGTLELRVELSAKMLDKGRRLDIASATGQADLSVEGCVVGDGKAKLAVPGDPFLSQGLTFPRVRLGKVAGRVVLKRGRATLDKLRAKSVDAEASLEGYIDLRDPLPQSELHLYLRFKPSEALIKKEPTIELLANGMAAGKRSDGFIGFSITGTLAFPNSRPSREPPTGISERSQVSAAPSLGALSGGASTGRLVPTRPQPSSYVPPAPPPRQDPPPPRYEPPPPVQELPPPPPPSPEEPARTAPQQGEVDPSVNLPPSYPSNQRGDDR